VALGIAFEGCACKSAFHAGAAAWLLERGVRFAAVGGASSGSVTAASIATGRFGGVIDGWKGLGGSRVFDPARIRRAVWPFRMSEIVGDIVSEHAGPLRLTDAEVELAIPVTLLGPLGRTRRVLTRRDPVPVVEAVLASCFIPGPYSRVIWLGGRPAFDGAWQVRTPVDDVLAQGADRVIACVSNALGRLRGGYPREHDLPIPETCRVLAPLRPLRIGSFDFAPAHIDHAIQLGRESAEAFARENEAWLAGA
jgi:predicted acylesterase/phospholipase RssA